MAKKNNSTTTQRPSKPNTSSPETRGAAIPRRPSAPTPKPKK
jgi:hypothetical protein